MGVKPMTKRRSIWIVSSLVALAVAGLLLARALREPSYQGKSLSEWLDDFSGRGREAGSDLASSTARQDASVAAVRAIGTNAIPHLLRMLDAEDSPRKLKWAALLAKYLKVKINTEQAGIEQTRAMSGFLILGPKASPALPELMKRVNGPGAINGNRELLLFRAISSTGKDSIPYLHPLLTNRIPTLRGEAAIALSGVNPSREIVADLARLLGDENTGVRGDTAVAFSNLRSELALPALIRNLRDTNAVVRQMSAFALGFYGKKAAAAIPELEQTTRDPDPRVSQEARQALDKIPRD